MNLMLAGRLARGGALADGWVEVEGERIAATGSGAPPRPPDERHDGIVAPGLFDLQVNGAGGHEVTAGAAALDAIDAIQLAHGVTSYLPTVVSADDTVAERVVAELAERTADPASPVAGIHLEGPFLSGEHAGMHPVGRLRSPADGVPAYYSSPAVRLVTLAPELPGAHGPDPGAARARRRGLARDTRAHRRRSPGVHWTPARGSSPTCSTPWRRCITARPASRGSR